MIKAIFLDLDYTLYDQQQYLRGAFSDVAYIIAREYGLDIRSAYTALLATWKYVGTDYRYLFNDWLDKLGLYTSGRVRRCVNAFHAHQPERLTLYPGVEQTLSALKHDFLVGLITDGDATMQQSKVAALNLEGYFDLIVCAGHLALQKPDPRIFQHALSEAKLSAVEALHVGDHPIKDIVGARQAGLPAIRVRTGEFSMLPDDPFYLPCCHLARVNELPKVIHSAHASFRA